VNIVGVGGSSAVPRVPEEQTANSQPQPSASEAANSPMDVDSPTPGL